MRTKRFLGSVLAMLCTIAVISSGFALWVFQYKTTKTQSKIDLTVEQAVNVGEITVADAFGINFDQTSKPSGWDLGGTSGAITINFADRANTVASYDLGTTDIEDNMEVKFTVAITVSSKLAGYIDIITSNDGFGKSTSTNEEGVAIIYFTSTTANEFDWTKVNITYKTEPANLTEYRDFANIVDRSTISVVYTAEVVGKGA